LRANPVEAATKFSGGAAMAKKATKKTARGCKQDRARVAGGQRHESQLRGEEDRPLEKGSQEGG
jgi:hypothetical protein